MSNKPSTLYEFGEFRLDLMEHRLLRGGKPVVLTPKALQLLAVLVQNSGRLLTKEELMKRIWPDSYVEEANLKVMIATIRRVFGEASNGRRYIETVPRGGYRFYADVRCIDRPPPEKIETPNLDPRQISRASDSRDQATATSFLEMARQHLYWLLSFGMLALVVPLFDIFLVRPIGIRLLGDVATITIIVATATLFLLGKARSITLDVSVPLQAAFRGLLPFESSDVNRFYGRDLEASAMIDLITHREYQFGVLHGERGCGKTSLMLAGVLPRLTREGYVVAFCRSYQNPIETLTHQLRKWSQLEPGSDEPIASYVKRIAEKSASGVVIIWDQLDELLLLPGNAQNQMQFTDLLTECYSAASPLVKFLFGIRSDSLHVIVSAFEGNIPQMSMLRRYRLNHFDVYQAQEVIEKSVRRANWPFDVRLSQIVAQDLAVDGVVFPPELQIIGEQLQSKRIFTLAHYRSVGGTDQLVHRYLAEVFNFAKRQQTEKTRLAVHQRMALHQSRVPQGNYDKI